MMTIAKGAVLKRLNQPLVVEELEWCDPGPNQLGVRIVASGVCHTDYHAVTGEYEMDLPILLGHEGVGIVEKVGENCKRVKEGDHVVLSWMPSCGHCPSCVSGFRQLCDRGANLISGHLEPDIHQIHTKDGVGVDQFSFLGCFSEYVVILEDGAEVVDKDLDLLSICIIGCRIPTGWGAVVNAAKVQPGSSALVVGLGGVGFNVLQGLKTAGAVVIIAADIKDKRKWAMEWGATHYIDASIQDITDEVMKITGVGVDYAFDAIGDPKAETACVESLNKAGTAVFAGVPPAGQASLACNPQNLIYSQKRILGTLYGHSNPSQAVPQLIKLYRAGLLKMGELITREYTLEQVNEAFDDMLAGRNICGALRMG
jgi:S-(hydroxymethyl)glutathione dehydrogenase/alcohol dehydrogenase